ncbi:MAG: hypothetical protein ACOYOK_03045 [Pseudobdellovibrionaceae bacterium]
MSPLSIIDTVITKDNNDNPTLKNPQDALSDSSNELPYRVQIGETGKPDATMDDLSNLLQLIPDNKDILVSTDSAEVLQLIAEKSPTRRGLSRIIPFGSLVKNAKQSKLIKPLINYKNKIVNGAKNDRIGLIILTVNTTYDSFVWLHVSESPYSESARIAAVIYSALINISFGLDKDLWSKSARHIEKKILKLFDSAKQNPEDILELKSDTEEKNLNTISRKKKLMVNFAANTAMMLGLQAGRFAILGFDQSLAVAFGPENLAKIIGLSIAVTFSSWGWGELSADIDGQKYPFAKATVRRWYEIRNLLMGHIASSGKLIQPSIYGVSPWFAVATNGIIGLSAFLRSEKIINWLENSPRLEWTRGQFYKFKNSDLTIWQKLSPRNSKTLSCQNIFL